MIRGTGILTLLATLTLLGVGLAVYTQFDIRSEFRDKSPRPMRIESPVPISVRNPIVTFNVKFTRGGNNATGTFTADTWSALMAKIEDAKDGFEVLWGATVTWEFVAP